MMENKASPRSYFLIATTAVAISVSLSALIYVYYFQSYGLSLKRGLFGGFFVLLLSSLIFTALQLLIRKYYSNENSRYLKSFGFWVLLALLLSPCFFPIPHYPLSPLFQTSSRLAITVQLPDGSSGPTQLKGVWLRFDDKEYSYKDFQFSGTWTAESDRYFLIANSQGELSWDGKIGEKATLTIFPLDTGAHVTVLWDGEENTAVLADKPLVINKKSATPMLYYVLIVVAWIICLGFVFSVFFSLFQSMKNSRIATATIVAILVLLSAYTVYAQFENPEIKDRLDIQIGRHNAVITGIAPDPWQYRVFAEWLVEGVVGFVKLLGLEEAYFGAFVFLRVAQNLGIFILAYLYFRKLGFSRLVSLVGILFVTGALLNSFHQSDLSFNTYFDVIFYLSAALLILNNSFAWMPLLMLAASLNRETSGLIPFLALSALPNFRDYKSKLVPIAISLGVWIFVFFSLRALYSDSELFIPYGYSPGLPLLGYNLSLFSFSLLLRFFSFAPLVGLWMFRHWTNPLKRFFVVLIPAWFVVHFLGSVVSEARLFLVPQVLVFIPAFLYFVQEVELRLASLKINEGLTLSPEIS